MCQATLSPMVSSTLLLADNFALQLTFLSTKSIYVRFGNSVFRQVIGLPMGTNSAPLLADLFLHMSKAVEFSTTFRYIDDLFSVNNDNFGNSIPEIYPSELELKDTTLSSTEVCYLDTKIVHAWRQQRTFSHQRV